MKVPSHRWLFPPALVAALAIAGSLALHVPAYVGLGVLREVLRDEAPAPAAAPMEIEIVERRPSPTQAEVTEAEPEPIEHEGAVPEEESEPEAPPRDARREPERPDEPEPEVPVIVQATPPPPAPPPQSQRRVSVAHRSQDPDVEPPEDAQYLAEENSRVEEETKARVTNAQADDPEPQVGAAEERPPESEEEGDAAEDEVADLQDAEGTDERDPTPEEAQLPPPPERPRQSSRSRRPQASEAAEGDGRSGAADGRAAPREAAGGGRQAQGGGAPRTREVIVSDGTGTFRMRVPVDERPDGQGEGEGGGVAIDGSGRGREGAGRASGRAGRGRRTARGGGTRGRGAPDLRLSWSDFASVYGEEELRREREAWVEQRRSRTAGAGHQRRWEEFRAALENYDVHVRPGNQTALNTRADPFAAFIAAMHRRIHPRFADDFWRNLPSTTQAMLPSNPNMHTMLEIAIGPTGNVERIGVVATSGDILFDYGAYNAVMGAQPFSAPPESIRSPDGLVYLRWGFYANQRQCGTVNAEAYILANAPAGGEPEPPLVPGEPIFEPRPDARE